MEDMNNCLQATASYFDNIVTDGDGNDGDDGDTAVMVVERGVQTADPANSAPKFGDLDPDMEGTQSDAATREVKENTEDGVSLGDAIGASDSDTDRLIYTLGGADADSFGIDRMNGQLMTKAALNYEVKDTYSVTVTASDPSLATATVPVTINVTDENDNAVITGEKEFEYAENDDSSVASFEATDDDGHAIVWSVGGDDKAKFDISDDGELTFKSPPDFETTPTYTTYSVTIMATGGELKVSVKITNLDEPGEVTLDQPQPQVGRGLVASVTDPDSDPEDQAWQWAKSMDGETGWMDIDKATSANRSPVAADGGYYLRATATYTDMFGEGQTASAVTENSVENKTTANAAPSFDSHDTNDDVEGVQVTYEVAENSKGSKIGKKPLTASDTDNDLLLYSIVAEHGYRRSWNLSVDSSDYAKFDHRTAVGPVEG